VRGDLFVPGVDELDFFAFGQRSQKRDIGMSAQTKNVLDTACFEILDQLVRNQILHV
jgi:hypothetical protein